MFIIYFLVKWTLWAMFEAVICCRKKTVYGQILISFRQICKSVQAFSWQTSSMNFLFLVSSISMFKMVLRETRLRGILQLFTALNLYSVVAVTHIVTATNNKKGICPRTMKYLNGVLTGKWIVSYECKYFFIFWY